FQAEDGIRARNVTGVQTCALPISQYIEFYTASYQRDFGLHMQGNFWRRVQRNGGPYCVGGVAVHAVLFQEVAGNICGIDLEALRSEERRVGKSVGHGGAIAVSEDA